MSAVVKVGTVVTMGKNALKDVATLGLEGVVKEGGIWMDQWFWPSTLALPAPCREKNGTCLFAIDVPKKVKPIIFCQL